MPMTQAFSYSVPGISCSHCVHAITTEVQTVAGVEHVDVDIDTKTVTVSGESLEDAAIVAAIDQAGYEVAA